MSSRCLRAASLAFVALAALSTCDRERRDMAPSRVEGGPTVQTTPLVPGPERPLPVDPRGQLYENSAYHVSEGSRLFRWFNCNGCHANGGGGMGPPLIDEGWIYGSTIEQIYGSIAQGRPNGMPSFQGKATEQQIWQLAAYVRSLGGFTPQSSSSRRDAVSSTPPQNQMTPPDEGGDGGRAVQGTAP